MPHLSLNTRNLGVTLVSRVSPNVCNELLSHEGKLTLVVCVFYYLLLWTVAVVTVRRIGRDAAMSLGLERRLAVMRYRLPRTALVP